ncbi:MAG: type II glyceraldehyde-3-phosphate dehydrogenase [Candidatus Aenigmarchaeota archaeon]|nr:type II glyceraldehyde-3-phosphate dehydrogenase [Candidatus Aenigmarchaeota archaeon]
MVVRVCVNGIGTIGKRIAHAIRLQDDMKLVAISTTSASYVLRTVLEPNGPLYGVDLWCSVPEKLKAMRDAGMFVNGTLEELLASGKVDIVVDCTPEGVGAQNKPLYQKYGVKAIFQGGEKANVGEMTFNSFVNYEEAINKNYVRVPSCNTTSLIRTLNVLDKVAGIEKVFATIIRRASDPADTEKTILNTIEPTATVPSHHGPDVQTVLKHVNIKTMAFKVPTTLAHVHAVHAQIKNSVKVEELQEAFLKNTRIIFVSLEQGYKNTANVIERFRDLCRPRNDMYEVAIWKENLVVEGKDVYWSHMVHQEAIIVPENVDCIRAMCGIEKDAWKSIRKTNQSLGI